MILYLKLIKLNVIKNRKEVLKFMVEFAFNILSQIVTATLPVAVIIEFANLIISTFLNAAFRGRLWFGKY